MLFKVTSKFKKCEFQKENMDPEKVTKQGEEYVANSQIP